MVASHEDERSDGAAQHDENVALTRRELEMLELIAEACRCVASPTASRSPPPHVQRLHAKRGVRDRGAAMAEGMRRGLLD